MAAIKKFRIVAVNEPDPELFDQGMGELVGLGIKAHCKKIGVNPEKVQKIDLVTADNRTITIDR